MSTHALPTQTAPDRTFLARAVVRTLQPATPWLLGLAFVMLNLQVVSVTGGIVDGEDGPAVKLYHAVFAGLALMPLLRGRLPKVTVEFQLYYLVAVATGLAAYLVYGFQFVMANIVFACYAGIIGAAFGGMLTGAQALRSLRIAHGLLVAGVLVKAAIFADRILAFFAAPFGHPSLPMFYGGGSNLEATWIALGAALFVGTRLLLPMLAAGALVGMLYASRVGIIIAVFIGCLALARALLRSRIPMSVLLPTMAVSVVVLVLGVALVGALAQDTAGVGYIVQRFTSIGDEPGSLGRLTLWEGGRRVFLAHPLGVGQGNAIGFVERALGEGLIEDNLHNLYLQHLVETGFQGFLALLVFAVGTGWRLMRRRLDDPVLCYVIAYLVAGMIQFRGGESIVWFLYGVGVASASRSVGTAHPPESSA